MADDAEVEAVARAIHDRRHPTEAWGMVEPIAASFFKAEARAAIAALDGVRGWRPIETCHRDGTPVVFAWPDGLVQVGEWSQLYDEDEWDGGLKPTHWMPLPPAPEDAP